MTNHAYEEYGYKDRPITPFTELAPDEQAEANQIGVTKILKLVMDGLTKDSGSFVIGLGSGTRTEVPYSFSIGSDSFEAAGHNSTDPADPERQTTDKGE